MRLIHCADLHLDSPMTANLTKDQAKERKKEMLRTFVRMVDYAVKYKIRVILIAGDWFDTHNISLTTRNTVWDSIRRHPEIDFLYLRGNHDWDGNFISTQLDIPENLKLFSGEWQSYKYGNVEIWGVEMGQGRDTLAYGIPELDPDAYNIVTLHGQLTEYRNKNQLENIALNDLRHRNIDYLALGHVHEYQAKRLDARGIYCYPGCLEGRGFDECGEKGFVLLDIDESAMTAEIRFVPAAQRCLYILSADVTGSRTTQDAARMVEKAVAGYAVSRKSLVTIELTGAVDVESEFSLEFLQEMFKDYFYFVKIVDKTTMSVDYHAYEHDVSLKGEFIRMVMQSGLPEETRAEIIRCGLLALAGEEV